MKLDYDISTEEMELIENYLADKLSPEDARLFEEKSKSDSNWSQKIVETRLLLLGVQESSLRSAMNQYHEGTAAAGNLRETKTIPMLKKWLVAASVFLFISVAAWFLLTNKSENRSLYAKYYAPDPGLLTAMGPATNYNFDKGMVEYKNEEYEKALTTWNALVSQIGTTDTLTYFMGMANQALGRYEVAKSLLSGIVADSSRSFYKDACWYYGLILLHEKNIEEASTYIEKSTHPGKAALLHAIKSN